MRIPKRDQQLLIGVVLLAAILVGVYYGYILKPLAGRVVQLRQEIRTKTTQVHHIEQAIAQEGQLRSEYDQFTKSLDDVRTSLPGEEALASAIELLSNLATQSGVKIQTIFPQRALTPEGGPTSRQSDLYKEIPIQIDALAGFHQLGSFLSRVESHEQPMQLKNLRVTANPKEPKRHTVKLVFVAFFAVAETNPSSAQLVPWSRRGS